MSGFRFTRPSSIVRRGALAFAAACALAGPLAWAQERARLIGVQAGGDAAASSVEVIGDRPLSFTTLKLRDPPRVVVDFAETELSGAPREVDVADGTIVRVAAAAAGQKTARVVIELAGEADFDVRARGNRVEVRVPRIAPMIARAGEPSKVATAPAAEAPAPAATAEAPGATAEAPKPAATQTETEKRASLPTVALVGSRAAPPAPVESAAARKRRERDERVAAYAAAQSAAAEKAAAAQKATREQRAALAEKAAAAKRERALAAAEKAAAARRARAFAIAEKAAARRALAEKKRQRKFTLADARHSITGIGFRPVGDGEVIVHSNQPLEYGVSGEENAVLVHLPSAAIPLPNNRRPLDTRFFNGPVQRVVPLAVSGGTDLRIELHGHPAYRLAQSGTVLTVTFSAPR